MDLMFRILEPKKYPHSLTIMYIFLFLQSLSLVTILFTRITLFNEHIDLHYSHLIILQCSVQYGLFMRLNLWAKCEHCSVTHLFFFIVCVIIHQNSLSVYNYVCVSSSVLFILTESNVI